MAIKNVFIFMLSCLLVSCVGTNSTIKNIDKTAIKPKVKNDAFLFTEKASNNQYGYDADYPINIGLILERQEERFITYFFNGLKGVNNSSFTYAKKGTCCPFPTKNNTMGAGTLSIYEVTFTPSKKKKLLYFNCYERGKVMCPKGFEIKKQE